MDKINKFISIKILSFVISLSLIIGISSFMIISSSAESVVSDTFDITDFKDGTLGDYPVVNSIYSQGLLQSYLQTTSDTNNSTYDYYMPFIYYNKKLYFGDHLCYIRYNGSYWSGLNNILFYLGSSAILNPITSEKDFSSSSRTDDFHNISFSTSNTTISYQYAGSTYSTNLDFTSYDGTLLNSTGDYDIIFARVLSSKSQLSNLSTSPYISSSLKYSEYSYSAKFLHLSTKEDDPRIKLNFIDHIVAKNQYPTFDLQINDNGMHYTYSVRVGVNTQYSAKLEEFWLNEDYKQQMAANSFGLFIPHSAQAAATMIASFKYLTECDTWAYDYSTSISSELFSFAKTDVSSRIYSLNLSDYISIIKFNIYQLEIVCNETSQVLSTTYFTCPRSYARSESDYGIKSYDYSSSSDADADSSGSNYTGNFTQGSTGASSNPQDIVSNAFKDTVSSINITDFSSSLQGSISNVSVFFQSCWGLFPPVLWSIILTGLSLIVILRVLGR